jgi:phosphoribosyl 1,2-cyclic phosphodiesterase
MRVRFWGVRGSLPSPLSSAQIKSKISAILERIGPDDIRNSESRERFLAALPPWLFGTVGSNTPCVEVRSDRGDLLILDAGSGIRELGIAMGRERPPTRNYHIFFSHLHWDHLQGLPFFSPAYDPSVSIDFYSPMENLEQALRGQMATPYFPVTMDAMGAKKTFHRLGGPEHLRGVTVAFRKMNHPGASYSYMVDDGKKRCVYATDTELSPDDFLRTDENAAFFGGADLLILDAQYTLGEAIEKYNWGHSAFSMAVDFASNWGIRKLLLFHHDPTYDDKKLFGILQSATWYTEHMAIKGLEVGLAMEGTEFTL